MERQLTPTGISGDVLASQETSSLTNTEVGSEAVKHSRVDELATKVNLGTATPDEEAELIRYFSSHAAHHHN